MGLSWTEGFGKVSLFSLSFTGTRVYGCVRISDFCLCEWLQHLRVLGKSMCQRVGFSV